MFGSSTDLMDVMRAKHGVAIRNGRAEIGAERYQPTNPHSMSREEYQDFAEQHQSLASIAQRGASQQLQLNDPSVGVESGAELTMDSIHERPPKGKLNQSQQELRKLDAYEIQGGDSHLYSPRAPDAPSLRTYIPKFLPPSLVSIQKITHNEQSRNSDYSRTIFTRKKVHHESVDFTYGGYDSQSASAKLLVDPYAMRDRKITYGTTELG